MATFNTWSKPSHFICGSGVREDEIISKTKNVVRGLETLKNEHSGILKNMGLEISNGEANVKADILKTSLEKIELGIGEAQVLIMFGYC